MLTITAYIEQTEPCSLGERGGGALLGSNSHKAI